MSRLPAAVPALVATILLAAPALAQDDRARATFDRAEIAYPQSKAPALYGPGSASEAYAPDPRDAVWAPAMESRILALLRQEQDRGLLVNRADVECRTAVCALRLIHVASSGETSVGDLVDSLDRSLPFASVIQTAREIPISSVSASDGMVRTSFMSGYVEIVLVGVPRTPAAASPQTPPAPLPDPVRAAGTVTDLPDREVTTPALPGIPEYMVRAFRIDGMAAQTLAAEPDDPQWSGEMEARIREIVAGETDLALGRLEVECRTTRCGVLAVHAPAAEVGRQSEILSRLQSSIPDALGFEGSVVGSIGQTDTSRFTALYFDGFPNLGPRALPVWLLSFGLAQDPREQLMVADEIVQAQAPWVLGGMEPWLEAASSYARANAAYVYVRYGDPRGMVALSEIVAGFGESGFPGSPDRRMSADELEHAVYLLGNLDYPGAFEALWRALEGEIIVVGAPSRAVERALTRAADDSGTPFLIRQLESREPLLRAMAIELLAGLGAGTSVPALETLLDDQARPFRGRPMTVGDLAREAIAAIRSAEENP